MGEKSFLNSLRTKKYFALFVGLIVAGGHFIITVGVLILEKETYSLLSYLSELIGRVLLAPSIVPIMVISNLLQIDRPAFLDFSPFALFVLACASAFYGVTGGLLASNQKDLQQVGIALMSLLTLTNCCVLVLIY